MSDSSSLRPLSIAPTDPSQSSPASADSVSASASASASASPMSTSSVSPVDASRKSSIPGAVFNFLNSIVGAGIIGIPYAISVSGFATGIGLLVLVSFITIYSVNQLILLASLSNTKSYEDLVATVLKRPGSLAIR